ncbi:Ni/Fe hydrogenase subunit alpha [Burkholderia sp. LA-2-3-30-S1-D2]|uniref:Ni/Fe hydrogenase subunit alpha n=1 Tax=Burkholderia sp. LA-2-3-30-S1-D2 TaxID=1637862 RepID=UPI00075B914B|nr:nickel-dependent hydrogenase large subunit [Burkholderia sp. LA-2-3-30-S1-D2]AOI95239.1 dehydrogenase [Burkholderia sp. LA-2-3-30-S1-D2]KVE19561.1 dehydrogenase [Burkholderia sp. LA-2-3-30-S1-D2]
MATKTIRVDYLTRVEGEGALDLHLKDGQVTSAQLNIFEPPRLFEALLRGRGFGETPDIVARICGICPIAYQMSAVHALETAFGIKVDGQLRALRRLIYCGEWIESHALHVVMLHAPDFLGFPDAIQMAREHGDAVRRGLALKKAGNELMRLLGGREIHPVNVKVGGFYRVPGHDELTPVTESLQRARDHAVDLVRWVAGFDFPEFERDYEFVALRHADEYPFNEGRLVSTRGIDIDIADFETEFEERHVAHSTALHAAVKQRGAYLVGPLARYAINFDRFPHQVQALAREAGLGPVCRNPFRSIVVRSLELVYACEEALRLIATYEVPELAAVPVEPRAGTGFGCTEAPRGICWHRYRVDADGAIVDARIVPPTSQNQPSIEADLMAVATAALDQPDDVLRDRCERSIRNYDPCISCSAHFLKLSVHRT